MVKEGSLEVSLTVVEKGSGGLVVCLVKGFGFWGAKLKHMTSDLVEFIDYYYCYHPSANPNP